MEKSLLNCCEKFYVVINEIIRKITVVNVDFFEVLLLSFDQFEAKALLQGFSAADVNLSKYALVALLDELIACYYPNSQHHWPARSLQLYYYQTNIAGNLFFKNLDELLLDKNKNRSVLEIYYFCLQLNFQGQYGRSDQTILDYRQQLKNYFNEQLPVTGVSSDDDQTIPVWLLSIIILFLFLIVYAAFIVFMDERVLIATADLNIYAEQLMDV